MEAFFTSLSKKQTMLLLTAVTFGGQESLDAFDHLLGDDAEVLHHRAKELLEIPRERRIPILVQEIKRLVTAKRGYLWTAEPSTLARVLKHERGALVEVLLRALPVAVAEAVRKELPVRPAKLKREVKPEILNVVRWKLEEVLAREVPAKVQFRFSDLLLIQPREVLTLVERIGARAMGPALAGLEPEARDGFLGQLGPDHRALLAKMAEAAQGRALADEEARGMLARHSAEKTPTTVVWSVGAERLAKACLAQSPEFAQRLYEKQKGELSPLFLRWMREEKAKGLPRGDAGRAEVVLELEKLAQAGLVERPMRMPAPYVPPPPRPPKGAKGGLQEIPAVASPPRQRRDGPRRDPIAEREARRAGALSSQDDINRPFRDPIAERTARRAGAIPSRPPQEPRAERPERDPRLSRPLLPKPPGRRGG